MTKTLSQVLTKTPRDYTAQLIRENKECSMMYSPVDVSRIQYMTLKQQRAARRKQAQNQLVRQMAKVAVQAPPKKKKKNKPFATVGQTLGTAVGSMFGAPTIGSGVGRWLGKGIGSIFGSGDYEMVGQNPSYNILTNGAQIPKFSSTRQTNIVSHREYIGDLTGTANFTNRMYPLNPGSDFTFPWLATIAQCYQQYKWHGLIFEFRPLITDFVTGGAPGVIVMATNYNADEPAYISKQHMENSEFAVSVKPTCNLMHGVECAPGQTPLSELYVRPGGQATGLDLKFTDLGNFQFATQGNPVQTLGELWVSYTIEFFKPLLPQDVGGDVQSQTVSRSGVSGAAPFGTIGISSSGDLSGFAINSTGLGFTAQGNNLYLVTFFWQGTVGVTFIPPVSYGLGNCAIVNTFQSDAVGILATGAGGGAAATTGSSEIVIRTLGQGAQVISIVPTGLQPPTGTTNFDLVITQLSNNV
jgi:hypothetical protein